MTRPWDVMLVMIRSSGCVSMSSLMRSGRMVSQIMTVPWYLCFCRSSRASSMWDVSMFPFLSSGVRWSMKM